MATTDPRDTSAADVLATFTGSPEAERAMRDAMAKLGALGQLALRAGAGEIWSRPGLARRDRSLVVIAMLTALGRERELENHVAAGLRHGLGRSEIDEILLQASLYAGMPFALAGAAAAARVFAAQDGARERTSPPSPLVDKSPAMRRSDGLDVLRTLLGQRSEDMDAIATATIGALGEMGRLVVDLAFGEVWSRPELSRRDRSLAVIAILTAISQPRELETHLRGALRHGVTPSEIEEVMLTAVLYAGFPRAIEGRHTAQRVLAETSGS